MSGTCCAISKGKRCRHAGAHRISGGEGGLAYRATHKTGGGFGTSLSFDFRGASEGFVCDKCAVAVLKRVYHKGLTGAAKPGKRELLMDVSCWLDHTETGITAAELADVGDDGERKARRAKAEARRARQAPLRQRRVGIRAR